MRPAAGAAPILLSPADTRRYWRAEVPDGFILHTDAEVAQMLGCDRGASIDELFDEIPASLRVRSLDGVPAALNEMEIGRLMMQRRRRTAGRCVHRCRAY